MKRVLPVALCFLVACASEPAQPTAAEESSGTEAVRPVEVPLAPVSDAGSAVEPAAASAVPAAAPPAPEPAAVAPLPAEVPATPAEPAAARTGKPPAAPRQRQPLVADPAAAPQVGRVQVELAKLESDDGKVQAALFRTAAGFPDDPQKAAMRKVVKIQERRVDLVFENVAPGTFAVLVHHDENGDGKMQTGLFGMPAEGYGTSRDAPANFGPPSFEDARLTLAPGESKRIVIKMRY